MSSTYEAREVTVSLTDQGTLDQVDDPARGNRVRSQGAGTTTAELVLSGEHYGFNLAPYLEQGISLGQAFSGNYAAATNKQGSGSSSNNLALRPPELLKVDAGYWGAYKRWREFPNGDSDGIEAGKQREFAAIEGSHAWVCQFLSDPTQASNAKAATAEKLKSIAAPLLKSLISTIEANGCGVKLLHHGTATTHSDKLNATNLKIVFPDIHLPERWPDLPRDEDRYGGAAGNLDADKIKGRKLLQKQLRECQREPGYAFGSPLSKDEQHKIQHYLEEIARVCGNDFANWGNTSPGNAPDPADWPVYTITDSTVNKTAVATATATAIASTLPVNPFGGVQQTEPLITVSTYSFTPTQFMAEKNIVDREFRLRSTWFYARGPRWAQEVDAGDRDWFDVITNPATGNGNGDPSPAIDLCIFLRLAEMAKGSFPQGSGLEFYQVGDIFEAWVNREFLYQGSIVIDTDAGTGIAYTGIKQGATRSKGDHFQPRMDRDWHRISSDLGYDKAVTSAVPIKRYAFHPWAKTEMFKRYNTYKEIQTKKLKLPISSTEMSRRQHLLNDRIESVCDFRLPAPAKGDAIDLLQKIMPKALSDAKYKVTNRRGETEIKWNQICLDLLTVTHSAKCIYGNHDGYRGDSPLAALIAYPALEYVSEPGIWMEHSHRWDPYNRDGCAFGAGAANMTYYWFNNMCSKTAGEVEDQFVNQEQGNFIPGAAAWFLMVNFGAPGDWFDSQRSRVNPFGVYVNGHTHSAGIAKIKFKYNFSAQAKQAATKAKEAIQNIPVRETLQKMGENARKMLPF
jgi:hypothetical protein